MDRDLPLLPVLIFLASLIGSIFIYMNNVADLRPPLIAQLFSDEQDNVWALYRNQVMPVEHRYYDSQVTGYSLRPHGVNYHVGQIIHMRSGEYLINIGGQSTSLLHKVQRYLRLEEAPADGNESSLLKCDAGFVDCSSWGDSSLQFDTAWSGIELSDGRFIINDTARHQVLLVDKDGAVLDRLQGFRFPNDAIEVEDRVWIVDTNNNDLVQISYENNTLIELELFVDLDGVEKISQEHRFPSIARKTSDGWIVMSNDEGMAHPGIYDITDSSVQRLLPELADVSAIHLAGGNLYAADYDDYEIWKMNLESGAKQKLTGPAFQALQRQVENDMGAAWQRVLLQIFLLAVIGLVAISLAIKMSK